MDELTRGTWIVNTVKHLGEIKQNTSELAFFEATEQAGKAGAFLGRLVADKQEIINSKSAKVFARQSSISPGELVTYLSYLKKKEKWILVWMKWGGLRKLKYTASQVKKH